MSAVNSKTLKKISAGVLSAALLFTASACTSASDNSSQADQATHTVTDMREKQVGVPDTAQRVVATDNLVFRTLEEWGIKLVAAPKAVMSDESDYVHNPDVKDIGNHREPNLEVFVETDPDLVLNGYRFDQYYDQIQGLVPDAALVDTTVQTDEDQGARPLDEELRRQITLLGEIFGKQKDAAELIKKFDQSITDAQTEYDPNQTVMGLITSGGKMNYSAPGTGRAVGKLFTMVGLTPALDAAGSGIDKGEDISVEAIADANPDWIIVMDRDAAVDSTDDPEYKSAQDLIANNPALQNVTAVKKGQIIYLPDDFYTTEDIQAYTILLEQVAHAFKDAKKNDK